MDDTRRRIEEPFAPLFQIAAQNTDRELWRKTPGDFCSDSLHVTQDGHIGINVGGLVIVRTIEDWHKLAIASGPTPRLKGIDDDEWSANAVLDPPPVYPTQQLPGLEQFAHKNRHFQLKTRWQELLDHGSEQTNIHEVATKLYDIAGMLKQLPPPAHETIIRTHFARLIVKMQASQDPNIQAIYDAAKIIVNNATNYDTLALWIAATFSDIQDFLQPAAQTAG